MRHIPALTLALLMVVGGFRSGQAADYWPGWLGPKRDGWVKDFTPPATWPKNLKRRWQVSVGIGYGSPVVVDGRVYQHARLGENEVVWCLDLKTGKTVWRKTFAVPFKIGGGGEYHGKGPKSCPVYADGRLFTLSINSVLTARNAADGEVLWTRDYSKNFKKAHPYWGASTSPIVDGNRLIVHFGSDDEGLLVALETSSGKELWKQGKDGPSYSSPLIAELQGVRQVVEWNHESLVGVDIASGKLLWSFPFPHRTVNQNMPTPTIHQGRVYLGGENRGIHCLEPVKKGDDWSVKQHWHQKKLALDMASAVMNDQLLYGMSHYGKGRLFCLDIKSGEILWQGPARSGAHATFLSIPGHVVALLDRGELQIVKASGREYTKVASYRVSQDATWAPPVLLKNGVLIKDRASLTLWTFESR